MIKLATNEFSVMINLESKIIFSINEILKEEVQAYLNASSLNQFTIKTSKLFPDSFYDECKSKIINFDFFLFQKFKQLHDILNSKNIEKLDIFNEYILSRVLLYKSKKYKYIPPKKVNIYKDNILKNFRLYYRTYVYNGENESSNIEKAVRKAMKNTLDLNYKN